MGTLSSRNCLRAAFLARSKSEFPARKVPTDSPSTGGSLNCQYPDEDAWISTVCLRIMVSPTFTVDLTSWLWLCSSWCWGARLRRERRATHTPRDVEGLPRILFDATCIDVRASASGD